MTYNLKDFENKTRWVHCKKHKTPKFVKYEYAKQAVNDINVFDTKEDIYAIVSGNFIFGQLIEGLFVENDLYTDKLYVSSLSLSEENAFSFLRLLKGGYIGSLELILSAMFLGKNLTILKDIYSVLDYENKTQISIAGTHVKVVQFETDLGNKIIIDGSANLRSSRCLEQFNIRFSPEIYDFNLKNYFEPVISKFFTINKDVLLTNEINTKDLRAANLWETIYGKDIKEKNKKRDKEQKKLNKNTESLYTNELISKINDKMKKYGKA